MLKLDKVAYFLCHERIMKAALEDRSGGICCGGMEIGNLRFANDINLLAWIVEKLRDLTVKVNSSANRLG